MAAERKIPEAWLEDLSEDDIDIHAQETSGGIEFYVHHEEEGDIITGVYSVSVLELAAIIDENLGEQDLLEVCVKYPRGNAFLNWKTQVKNFIPVWKWLRKYLIYPF